MFLDSFHDLLDFLNPDKRILIAGDFNLNFLSNENNVILFKDVLDCYGFQFVIKESTRISNSSSTCIDNILLNDKFDYFEAGIVDLNLADHLAQTLNISITKEKSIRRTIYKRCFNSQNTTNFLRFLDNENWYDLYNSTTLDGAFDNFFNIFMYHFDTSFPLRKFYITDNDDINHDHWINDEIIALKRQLSIYSDLSKRYPQFIELRNEAHQNYNSKLKDARRQYYDRQISQAENKQKQMWQIISKLQNKTRPDHNIEITENNIVLTDIDLANRFNQYFTTVPLPSTNKDLAFLESNVPMHSNSLFLAPLVDSDIIEIIDKLKCSNSSGFDNISNNLLKKCKYLICKPLAFIVNIMFQEGAFPSKLKLAIVNPSHKKSDTNIITNYRPISLLSSFSKVLEVAINEQLTIYLYTNKIISPNQHGYTRKKNTDTAVTNFVSEITRAVDNKIPTLGLFVDFTKAFDNVDHELLLEKLSRYGIRGINLQLFKTYLEGRTQKVQLSNGKTSISQNILAGVPQGSILGPSLFLIFANDLNFYLRDIKSIKIVQYADDTNILITAENIDSLMTLTCTVYNMIVRWAQQNYLCLNQEKTQCVLFKSRKSIYSLNNNFPLQTTDNVKMLGITLDNYLQWNSHIEILCGKLGRSCYALRFLKNFCSSNVLKTLYYSSFHSHLRNGIINWGSSGQIQRVFILQKVAIRILANLGYRESCRNVFQQLEILTVIGTYIYEVCCFVFKNKSIFTQNITPHDHNTRHKLELQPDSHSTSLYQRSIIYNGCKLFNFLPPEIKESANQYIFKRSLKKYLVNKNCYTLNDFFT